MPFALLALLCLPLALSSPAGAQNYQQVGDGLVTVRATRLVGEGGGVSFDICARLTRPESAGPLEVHLNFWGAGGVLARSAPLLRPAGAGATCRRIALPSRARGYLRWEISRLRFRTEPVPPPSRPPLARAG